MHYARYEKKLNLPDQADILGYLFKTNAFSSDKIYQNLVNFLDSVASN